MEVQKITIFELGKYVEIAYKGDADLLDKYWGIDFSLIEAVNETMCMIKEVSKDASIKHYAVLEDGDGIGYMSCLPNNLYSFGINIQYRTKELLIAFWAIVKEIMGESFICMLFPQNTRAIEFLKKQGMVEINGVEQNCTVLLNI